MSDYDRSMSTINEEEQQQYQQPNKKVINET